MTSLPACEPQASSEPTSTQLQALYLPMVIFVLISVADTISSVYMLAHGIMEEYNPLMRLVWEAGGPSAFCAVKAALVLFPLWLFNRLKVARYRLVHGALWVTILGYALIYGCLFTIAN